MTLNRSYSLTHSPIDFVFSQNSRDFVVEEVPLYDFSNSGEHLILKIRKKGLSTWEMLEILSTHTGVKIRDFGCAGLKDKEALTYQYISVNKKFQNKIESFSHDQIKIIETTLHNNKIKKGHLKGNKFFIRLKKVLPLSADKIFNAVEKIKEQGVANYFGYQRFGNDDDNHMQGKQILEGNLKIRNPTIKTFLINAYQSHLFNSWLSKRVELSHLINNFEPKEIVKEASGIDVKTLGELKNQKHFFKILKGDVISHYPHGKIFYAEDADEEAKRFFLKNTVPTGLLSGKKTKKAIDDALIFEKEFDTIDSLDGDRRFAWIFPENFQCTYKENEAWFEIGFFLPKGSYATNVIQEIAKREIK